MCFPTAPGGGKKLFDPCASARKGQECARKILTKRCMFMSLLFPDSNQTSFTRHPICKLELVQVYQHILSTPGHTAGHFPAGLFLPITLQNHILSYGVQVDTCGGVKQGRFVILYFPLFCSVWGSQDTQMLENSTKSVVVTPLLCAPNASKN